VSKLLFLFQLVFLGILLYFADYSYIFGNTFTLIFLLGIAILGFYSFFSLRLELFSPFAEPVENHRLVTEGAYRYVRHPMYAVYALTGILLLLSNTELKNAVAFVLLLFTLEITAGIEEKLLAEKDGRYREYQKITKKFLPFIY